MRRPDWFVPLAHALLAFAFAATTLMAFMQGGLLGSGAQPVWGTIGPLTAMLMLGTHHDAVSILFADLVGFTRLSQELSASDLVGVLDELFAEIDALVDKHGVEKIKTIGDCYMVASGLPDPREDHAPALADFALDLRDLIVGRDFNGRQLGFRIGMPTGPVVAGVIGTKRFCYDIFYG